MKTIRHSAFAPAYFCLSTCLQGISMCTDNFFFCLTIYCLILFAGNGQVLPGLVEDNKKLPQTHSQSRKLPPPPVAPKPGVSSVSVCHQVQCLLWR